MRDNDNVRCSRVGSGGRADKSPRVGAVYTYIGINICLGVRNEGDGGDGGPSVAVQARRGLNVRGRGKRRIETS